MPAGLTGGLGGGLGGGGLGGGGLAGGGLGGCKAKSVNKGLGEKAIYVTELACQQSSPVDLGVGLVVGDREGVGSLVVGWEAAKRGLSSAD